MKSRKKPDPAIVRDQRREVIGDFIRSAGRDDLENINALVRARWAELDDEKRSELKVGDIVWFNAKRRGTIYGRITHFNRKRLGLVAESGLKWKVSAQLLNLVTDKKRADEIRTRVLTAPSRDVDAFAGLLSSLGGRRRR